MLNILIKRLETVHSVNMHKHECVNVYKYPYICMHITYTHTRTHTKYIIEILTVDIFFNRSKTVFWCPFHD